MKVDNRIVLISCRLLIVVETVKQHRDVQETPSLRLKMKNYFIASQDKDLRMRVGSVPGVPIIYLNKVTLVLEPPSQDSRDFSKEVRHHVEHEQNRFQF